MKRNKAWWARLSKEERSQLWCLEHTGSSGRSSMIPDDCVECPVCSTPHAGFGGLCLPCNKKLDRLIVKAERESI